MRAVGRESRRQQVACDLLLKELGVREVGIECLDDVVAVAPGVELVVVELVTVGFGPAHEIQPVTAPPLSVVGRAEQPFHRPCEGIGGCVL